MVLVLCSNPKTETPKEAKKKKGKKEEAGRRGGKRREEKEGEGEDKIKISEQAQNFFHVHAF